MEEHEKNPIEYFPPGSLVEVTDDYYKRVLDYERYKTIGRVIRWVDASLLNVEFGSISGRQFEQVRTMYLYPSQIKKLEPISLEYV